MVYIGIVASFLFSLWLCAMGWFLNIGFDEYPTKKERFIGFCLFAVAVGIWYWISTYITIDVNVTQ